LSGLSTRVAGTYLAIVHCDAVRIGACQTPEIRGDIDGALRVVGEFAAQADSAEVVGVPVVVQSRVRLAVQNGPYFAGLCGPLRSALWSPSRLKRRKVADARCPAVVAGGRRRRSSGGGTGRVCRPAPVGGRKRLARDRAARVGRSGARRRCTGASRRRRGRRRRRPARPVRAGSTMRRRALIVDLFPGQEE
jgi:hypothetical protein